MVAITGTGFTHLPFFLATPEAVVLLTFCIIDRFSWLCFPELPFCWPLFIVKLTSAPVNPVHKLSSSTNIINFSQAAWAREKNRVTLMLSLSHF